ncbi:inorganic phosphate transporter [Brachybacterium sp. UMB0905]|uniref:inorganic phosphate transporter n=1 Tax=Brachybacterium sp. UMB0905 TaxID=2069310 RepID=UPI001303FF6C|nr:inorganic phosphate transporter [Brachybacterium sp. UMB0905]
MSVSAPPEHTSSTASEDPAPSGAVSDRTWHLTFAVLLAVSVIAFTLWAHGQLPGSAPRVVLILTVVFGLFMAFNIGGNDVANSFGTSVGAGTLTMKQALLVAAVFEVGGAVIAGGAVTETVRSGIVNLEVLHLSAPDFAIIMMSALLGAAIWLLIATRRGWPVSTTHSIVGGIVGGSLSLGFLTGQGGLEMVQWGKIGQIVSSWFLSPLLGGIIAYLLYTVIKRGILRYDAMAEENLDAIGRERKNGAQGPRPAFERLGEIQHRTSSATRADLIEDETLSVSGDANAPATAVDPTAAPATSMDSAAASAALATSTLDDEQSASPTSATAPVDAAAHRALELWVPLLAALGAVVITAMMLFKGLSNIGLELEAAPGITLMVMIAAGVWMAVFMLARTLRRTSPARSTFFLFSWMQVFTACAFAFSHGANDIANAVGPFAAVFDVLRTGEIADEAVIPAPLLIAAGVALVAGLWFVGRRVITTVGSGLTRIHPASGFAAELSAAAVVLAASVLGLPVSSTHILIGAVLGVGLVNRAANWKLMKPIAMAWVITVPAAAVIGALGVLVLRAVLG